MYRFGLIWFDFFFCSEIGKVLTEIGSNDGQEQVILDIISLTDNEPEEENVKNGDDNSDDDENNSDDDQENAENPSLDNENDAPAEQQNGDEGEMEMATAEMDGTSDKENVQPHSKEDVTAEQSPAAALVAPVPNAQFLKPAPVNSVNGLVQQNTNAICSENGATAIKVEHGVERKQCFWCEESFIKESSLRNHLESDHGIVFVAEKEKLKEKLKTKLKEVEKDDQDNHEPGKYVRPSHSFKRKRSSIGMAENNDDTENRDAASQPASKRKCAKMVSEPLRRSYPRV